MLIIIHYIMLRLKGIKPLPSRLPGKRKKYKRRSVWKRLLIDLPHRIALDNLQRDPDDFREHGMIIFTGRQGMGKTSGLVEYMIELQKKYPLANCTTNFMFDGQDKELNHWKVLTEYVNGNLGVIAAIDETQNWFSCNESKSFPPEMLGVITQNRKNRRVICGTAQNFYMLAKAIRSQTSEVRECNTFFGCLTIVRRRIPILDCAGEVVEYKERGFYFFVHNEEIRNSYDTYKVIENLSKSGFQEKVIKE